MKGPSDIQINKTLPLEIKLRPKLFPPLMSDIYVLAFIEAISIKILKNFHPVSSDLNK